MTRTRNDAQPFDPSYILRPVPGASFALLDDRPVLFSEAIQKIYELNQMAGYIWCGLSDRKPADVICNDLIQFGLNGDEARIYVRQALQNWLKLGLLEVDWRLSKTHAFAANVGKLAVNVWTSSERLTQLLIPLFGQTRDVSDDIEDTFEIVELDRRIHIFHNKAGVARCAINELVPTLKAHNYRASCAQKLPRYRAPCGLPGVRRDGPSDQRPSWRGQDHACGSSDGSGFHVCRRRHRPDRARRTRDRSSCSRRRSNRAHGQ